LRRETRISKEIMYQMERDSCKVQNLIFEMDPGLLHKQGRLSWRRTKLDLENQKRRGKK